MWALTLKQPYAWMVIHGSKSLENRGWWNKIAQELFESGEPFAVHAGASVTRAYYREAFAFARQEDPFSWVPARGDLVLGAILGTAVIYNRVDPEEYRPPGCWGP